MPVGHPRVRAGGEGRAAARQPAALAGAAVIRRASGAKVSVFGLFTLPDLVPKDETLSNLFGTTHAVLGFVMTGLVLLHIGGALMHGLKRDGVLGRMLPPVLRT
ncbi:MAG: hypothetical protein B7Z30_10160 [Rhizobiales bacterium 12-68-15]|nr:MAG: hypothetical protein B7Z30_10160 [Rhizobiales bacterium 12-68-15]